MIWWTEWGYEDGWTFDSVIKFSCEVNIRWIHEEEDYSICVSSLFTWWKPNCDAIFSIALPSLVVMSLLHQILNLALKLSRSTTRKRLFCTADPRFSWKLSLKDWNRSCYWLGDLYNTMKLASLSSSINANLTHSF